MPTTAIETPANPYVQVPETSESLDWADLRTLDLAKYDLPGVKQELAIELTKAIEDVGFFYVKNYGLSKEEIDAQFGLAKMVLSLPNDEKQKYRAALEQGDYNGWKPAGIRNLIPGGKDNLEIYNIPKFIPEHAGRPHPEVVRAHWHTIERFSKHVHNHIIKKLLVIFAVALGLEDEEWLVKRHRYDRTSGDHLRYMKYYARSEEENRKLRGVWLKGSVSLPVAALQVLTKSGEWKYVRPQMEALTVNIADALQFMTNGYLKSSIHRVVAPPKDQAHIDRLGVLYMVRIEDDCDLVPIDESPVLQKHGLTGNKILGSDGQPLKAASTTKEGDNEVNDVEILKGVKVHYFD
ncbi:putative 1-aminocyclopropane-1-carboxylate oxidase [Aspergillus tetrazonus]